MNWLLLPLLLTQASPTEGWSVVEREDASPDLRPLPLGAGHPFDAPSSPAHQALLQAEQLLASLEGQALTPSDNPSYDARLEYAQRALKTADTIAITLKECATDQSLEPLCRIRAADANRLAAGVLDQVPPPVGAQPKAHRAHIAEIQAPMWATARQAYTLVEGNPAANPAWRAHARWALTQLPESK